MKLSREMVYIIVSDYGAAEFVRRVSDPVWFQSLGTVLAFDWNASGLTTILTAAIKEAIRGREEDLNLYVVGGKGKTSKKTPDEIVDWSYRIGLDQVSADALVYNSKMAAKVDSALVQDSYQLYHHAMFFTRGGARRDLVPTNARQAARLSGPPPVAPPARINSKDITWSIVQQGMNTANQSARRYHWYSDSIKDIVVEPQSGIASQALSSTLNLSSKKSGKTQELSIDLISAGYNSVMKEISLLRRHSSHLSKMIAMKKGAEQLTLLELSDENFTTHPVVHEDFAKSRYLEKVLWQACDMKPKNYEELLSLKGIGGKTMRALSLVSEVIYGAAPSYEDPARYSFAHGGKDEIPYPVDTKTYDDTIGFFRNVVAKMRLTENKKKVLMEKLDRSNN